MASRGPLEVEKPRSGGAAQASASGNIIAGDTTDVQSLGVTGTIMAGISLILVVLFFPFSLVSTLKIVKEYERAVILRLGKMTSRRAKGPGLFFVLPCIDTVHVVDLRTVTFDIPPQKILTKDSVTAQVDAVVYFRIQDPVASVLQAENARNSTYRVAQGTLRDVLGTKSLAQILSDREEISDHMGVLLDQATDRWGVKVERVELKDVSLPQDMQRSMAAEAEADREAKAKVVAAEGEQRAARKLREAADVMDESPATLQLRYLQTLNTISAENNHTYVFPLPLDLLRMLFAK